MIPSFIARGICFGPATADFSPAVNSGSKLQNEMLLELSHYRPLRILAGAAPLLVALLRRGELSAA
jgi:hypothetical protein